MSGYTGRVGCSSEAVDPEDTELVDLVNVPASGKAFTHRLDGVKTICLLLVTIVDGSPP